MDLYLSIGVPILIATAWVYTAQMTRSALPMLRNKKICLLIAHPDDEAMFFSPMLTGLTLPDFGNHIVIFCLSSGDADGLGETRKKELQVSATKLGLQPSDVVVLEDEKFPDSMTTTWPANEIAKVLAKAFIPRGDNPARTKGKTNSKAPPPTVIDTIITFDDRGVSSHPNHISLYHGARAWLSDLKSGKAGWKAPVEMYTLSSVNIIRKYINFLDAPMTLVLGSFRGLGKSRKWQKQSPPALVFVSGPTDWRRGQDAMINGHASQMVWFRWAWISLGRYMVVNDLKREYIV